MGKRYTISKGKKKQNETGWKDENMERRESNGGSDRDADRSGGVSN
jgi:hypothetical protein